MLKNLNDYITLFTLIILVIATLRLSFSLLFPQEDGGHSGRFLDLLKHYTDNEED